ncbi:MAG: hypothetical protein ACW98F_04755, partial [Candidatus Hodarchaeales archaeon]
MKKMKTRYIELGISLFLLVLLNFGNNATIPQVLASETQPTITQVFADRIEVINPDSIYFTIYVSVSGDPVSSGEVTLFEETDSLYAVTENLYNGMALIQWTPKPWTPTGWCNFIASYGGSSQYDTSSGNTQVSVNDPVITGSTPTETSVTPSTLSANVNETIEFDVTVDIIDPIFPLFSGGYITLVDVTEGIVLQHETIVDLIDSTYTTNLVQIIPALFLNGSHTFEIRYSGSYDVDHAASSDSVNIEIINNYTEPIEETFSLSMTSNTTLINRGEDTMGINATIGGDDPTGKNIQLYSYQDNGSIISLLDEMTVMTATYTYEYTPDETAIEGPIFFELTLLDELTYEIKAFANISATIVEPIIIYNTTISLDQEIYESISGDILTIPVYITSSSGNPITEGQVTCEIRQSNVTLEEIVANITDGYTEVEILTGTYSEGTFELHFSYPGNATQTATTHTAEMQIIKTAATFESAIDANTIEYGTQTSWFARVTTDSGVGIPDVPIRFETSLTGFYWDHWGTIMTNESGYATIEIIWVDETQDHYGTPGNYDVRISIEENEKVYTEEDSHSLSVTKNYVILTLENALIAHLGTGILQGTLTTSTGEPLADAEIDLYWNCTSHGWFQKINTVLTDEFGNYYQEVTITEEPAFFELEADYDGNIYYTDYTQNAVLEVLDNPSEIEKIEITPAILDLGDTIQINVTAADIDSISSVTAFIYYNTINFTLALEHIDSTYQTEIWCGTEYDLGTWTIDLIIIDNIGIETVFTNAGQFVIAANPAPIVNYTVTPDTIPDGFSVNFEVSASDTLGIQSVQIEIGSTVYDITDNITIIDESTTNTMNLDRLREVRPSNTGMRAREASVFYFTYSPSTTGIIAYTIYVTDNAGQIREISGSIMVEAIAPELSVLSASTLNGTAPFPFALKVNVTDGSGINYHWIYINGEQYDLNYNDSDSSYSYNALFPAGTYIITVIAEDIHGTQATLDIGTLDVEPAEFSVLYASENLFDGESTTFILQASTTLADTNVTMMHNNEETIETLDSTAILTGELKFDQPGTYTVDFSITDSLGTQISHGYTFNVSAKAPVIESIYPSTEALATTHAPLELNLESIVTDASGVASVILYINDTEYLLSNNFDLWYTTIYLERGNYTLTLIATDIYGAETTYILGELTAEQIVTTSSDNPTNTPTESPEKTQTTTDL